MDRSQIMQRLLELSDARTYLEVGVNHGITFHAVEASRKIAVDPLFNFDVTAAAARVVVNGSVEYHQVPSDEYFANKPKSEMFDVIFLDGLHTFDQTLRDLLNALDCLRERGVIVIDDTVPSSYAASLPTMEELFEFRAAVNIPEHAWMGDVFRLVFFVRDYLRNFSYATVAENHGQTVLWRARRPASTSPAKIDAIAGLSYADAMIKKSAFNFLPFAEIEQRVRDQKP